MNPQVPIALRMSGHLLLGVVRIYSKKVEYLQRDYNVLRIDISKVYANADINLPQDANQAKFDSITITLPDRFDLDLMDIDTYGSPDTHLRPHEDITLPENRDQIPAGYIRISFGEDNPSLSGNDSQSMGMPSPCPREKILDGGHDVSPPRHLLVLADRVEPDPELTKELSNSNANNNSSLPTIHEMVETVSVLQSNQPESTHSEPVNHNSVNYNSVPLVTYELGATPSVEQPRAKRRKIKYDEATVLTNEFMNTCVKDYSDLLRKRKRVPYSSLDAWRVNNRRKKENAFFDSLITGLNDYICEMFDDADMCTRAHEIRIEEEARTDDMEIEHQQENVNVIPTYFPAHNNNNNISFSSPPQMDEYTPSNVGSRSYPVQTMIGSTPDPTSSNLSDVETPQTLFQDHHAFDYSGAGALSDIPEVDDAGELAFIEEDGASPIRMMGTPQSGSSSGRQTSLLEIGSLQARTRAVAQYIKEKSSATPSSSTSQNAGLSLNSILEGKKRKVCARMFYQTLVLKSRDLVDVKQDEPYADIILKVTSKLAKHHFSN